MINISLKKSALFLSVMLFFNGCGYYKVFLEPDSVHKLNENVFYEDGAQDKAAYIASFLPVEMRDVEEKQYKPFAKPVLIYVFANQDTYAKYAVIPQTGAETQGQKRIMVSPKKENTIERMPRLVHHELSHYHLFGYTGSYKGFEIPTWFKEGLAVWVSNGGGAEGVSEDEAKVAIKNGIQINPIKTKISFIFDDSKPKEMAMHMFYMQSGMFVAYLHDSSPEKFKHLIEDIEDRKDFGKSFVDTYGVEPKILWRQFISEIHTN